MRTTKLPAGKLRVVGSFFSSFFSSFASPDFSPSLFFSFFTGSVIVIADFAREISTFCFCNTCNNSACKVPRGSSAGSTYATGPSAPGFCTDRFAFK